jgi:hypothetical protein
VISLTVASRSINIWFVRVYVRHVWAVEPTSLCCYIPKVFGDTGTVGGVASCWRA